MTEAKRLTEMRPNHGTLQAKAQLCFIEIEYAIMIMENANAE